jgi:hypothetical protein
MAADDMASMQFATASPFRIGADASYTFDAKQIGMANPQYTGAPDVTPLSSKTLSSYDRYTAWRLRRGASEAPQPHSRATSGSLYNFDQE